MFEKESISNIMIWMVHSAPIYGIRSLRNNLPLLAFIFYYNNHDKAQKVLEYSIKYVGKSSTYQKMLLYAIQNHLSIEEIDKLWNERIVTLDMRLLNNIDTYGTVEIIDYFLNSEKFWKKIKTFGVNDYILLNQLKNEKWDKSEKMNMFALKHSSELPNLLSADVKNIFVF